MGSDFWKGEGSTYPQVVFDAVKDNPSFSDLLKNVDPVGELPWFLVWFADYLHTIKDLPAYPEVLAKMVDFMCEELQHERFQEARPVVMTAATRVCG
jgi:senataxin